MQLFFLKLIFFTERRVLLEGRPPLQRPVAANKESVKWQDRPDISLYGGRRY